MMIFTNLAFADRTDYENAKKRVYRQNSGRKHKGRKRKSSLRYETAKGFEYDSFAFSSLFRWDLRFISDYLFLIILCLT